MTPRHRTGPLRHRLLAASVFAALLAQMALPALHALGTASALGVAPSGPLAATTGPPSEARLSQAVPAHDPAECPVCRSLMRTSPVATPPAASGASCSPCLPAPSAPAVSADFAVVMLGHPPRAPPAHAPHLA